MRYVLPLVLALATVGCAQKEGGKFHPQSAGECRQQFTNGEVSKFLDRVTTRPAKAHWPAAKVSFEVVAAKRPADKLENLVAKLTGDGEVSIETEGDLVVIAVDTRTLDQGAASLAKDLAEVCSIVSANDARLTKWRYTLSDVALDDGQMHVPAVS